jgi:hypothetical protein
VSESGPLFVPNIALLGGVVRWLLRPSEKDMFPSHLWRLEIVLDGVEEVRGSRRRILG